MSVLILDCILNDNTLFAREDEVLTSWQLFTPILEYWQAHPPTDFPNYAAGSWGPEIAERMLHTIHYDPNIGTSANLKPE